MESLSTGVASAAYGRNYSYFSHRVFVAYFPENLHKYLSDLMYQEAGAADPAAEAIEMQLIRWTLLHKSQLNALALNRHLEALRAPDDSLTLPEQGQLRSNRYMRTEITLQFAIELAIEKARQNPMLQERPRLQLALLDAGYYLSRLRLEVDRSTESGPGDGGGYVDLSEDTGRKAFSAYILSRMNLSEDRSVGLDEVESRATALTAEELDWLFSVAVNVASLLSSKANESDMQKLWTDNLGARWKSVGLNPPDQPLFAALLLGDASPLESVSPENLAEGSIEPVPEPRGSHRWRESKFVIDTQASREELAAKASGAMKLIARFGRVLTEAMYGTAPDRSSSQALGEPLRVLSDTYRVLPTTPAWASVEAAIARFEQVPKGIGSASELAFDRRMLSDYVQKLTTPELARPVVHALQLGAFLAGVRAALPETSEREKAVARLERTHWDASLVLLRDGLSLADASPEDTAERLAKAVAGMQTALKWSEAAPPPDKYWTQSGLSASLDAWFDQGLKNSSLSVTSDMEAQAREDTAKRLDLLSSPATLRGASLLSAPELFCYAAKRRPYLRLPLHFDTLSLRSWTKVLLDLVATRSPELSPEDLSDHARPTLESTVIASALERLGGGSLDEPALRMLLGRFLKSADTAAALLQRHKPLLWPADRLPTKRLAVVVVPESSEMTDKWPLPPLMCFCLVASPDDLRAMHMFRAKEMAIHFKEPVRLAVEHSLVDDGKVAEFIKERDVEVLVMFPRGMAGNASRHIVDPQSADELWRA